MSLQNELDTKRTMLDALRSNLASIESDKFFKKKNDDNDWRVAQLKENLIRCQQEIWDLEKEIIALRNIFLLSSSL